MRIRSTKPEFWRSSTVASVDWNARFVLKGLESYVDDNGVGKDDLALIVGDVFPRDMVANPRDTLARVAEAISILSEVGLLHRYKVEGKPLLYISNWDTIQRIDKPGQGRLPRPDGTMNYKESIIRESVASPRENVAPVTGEQGNRGTGEQRIKTSSEPAASDIRNSYPAEFDKFWSAYPKKDQKRDALKAWQSAIKRADNDELIAQAHRYAEDPNRVDRFTKLAGGWLRADMWLDGPLPARFDTPAIPAITKQDAKVQGYLDTGQRLAAQFRENNHDLKELT
ncbi:hypothetical protein ACMTN4_07330 [Rhodococcus globerulus]|uniref:hypothetical protein n=1 Tax=Rhodococcus globerulus TaxID=33008 RepID=UPI0039E8A9E7